MTRFKLSILAHARLYNWVFVLIFVALCASGSIALYSADQDAVEMVTTWNGGSALLRQVEYNLSNFRLAETYRALMPDSGSRAFAEALDRGEGRQLERLVTQYVKLMGEKAPASELATFNHAWAGYSAAHAVWIKSDPNGLMQTPAIYGSPLAGQYQATQAALDQLIAVNRKLGFNRAYDIHRVTVEERIASLAASLAAICFLVFAVQRIRSRLTGPLFAITEALTKVAAGDRHVAVPELDRSDEIGAIAKACEAFRLNVVALEQSHQAKHTLEAQLSAIVTSSADAVMSNALDGTVQSWNPAAEAIFGYAASEVIGQPMAVLIPPHLAHEESQFLAKIIHSQSCEPYETVRRRKNGTLIAMSITMSPIRNEAGKLIGVSKIARDITEQKRLEHILKQAKEDAEAGARAKAAFLANMSHEIRTPMNAILGFAEILQQDAALGPQNAEHVKIILGSARGLLTVINDILDISKLESGKLELESVAFDLRNALAEALRLMENQTIGKDIKIILDYDAGLPKRFLGDPTRLRQVVLNLVGNAIKFTERGSVTLSVAPAQQFDMLHFTIGDTGIGMTPEQSRRVFDAFSQADASTTRRFGGTGLGTTISKQIVELMGGKIWFHSEAGVGSTFHFTAWLPPATFGEPCLYEYVGTVQQDYTSPRAFNVLLAEDLEINATLVKLRLHGQGHQVEWVANGQEAVGAFRDGDYDLILMDVMMPVMDGLIATREIRKLEAPGERIAIIALTASAMRQDYNLCIEAGMDSVQAKPINFDALLSAMEEAVPAARGVPNLVADTVTPAQGIDFAPLEGIADHRVALRAWHDPAIYADALLTFAATHSDDATKMEMMLLASPDNAEPVRAMAHRLRGVAGNLRIIAAAELAAQIDADLRTGDFPRTIAKLRKLRGHLTQAAAAIGKIVQGKASSATKPAVFSAPAVRVLLRELNAALKKLNPDAAKPILAQLAECLPPTDLQPVQHLINAYSFKAAREKVTTLYEAFGNEQD